MSGQACEPCARDDCDCCRIVGCVCCGDAQDTVAPEPETCCDLGACDYDDYDYFRDEDY